jgi:hypothetical protein
MKDISVWFYGNNDKDNKEFYPMVLIGKKYHYRVKASSLKRLASFVHHKDVQRYYVGYNGWHVEFKEK